MYLSSAVLKKHTYNILLYDVVIKTTSAKCFPIASNFVLDDFQLVHRLMTMQVNYGSLRKLFNCPSEATVTV